MFHFGLFSTFIPYLIAGILYLIGVSHYGKDFLFPKKTNNSQEINFSEKVSDNTHNTISFFKEKHSVTDIYINDTQLVVDITHDTIIRFSINDSLRGSYLFSFYFSRPPPSIS